MALTSDSASASRTAAAPCSTLLKPALVLGLTLLLASFSRAQQTTPGPDSCFPTNCSAVPTGWLQVPSREVVLDFRSQGVDYGCRQDAGEFLLSVLNALLDAGYTVRLSDGYLQDEIVYYSLNLEREKPTVMSHGILDCLRQARRTEALDWACLKSVSRASSDPISGARHLPWMSPPVHSESVMLAGAGAANLPQLRLRLRWEGARALSAVQYSGRHIMPPRQGALLTREVTAWSFTADMRLLSGEQVLFEKNYPQEVTAKQSISAADRPLERTIQRILQDLDTGLKPKPEPPTQPKGKKSQKKADKRAAP